MKTVSILLSLIFAILSCIPCADSESDAVCTGNSKNSTEKQSNHSGKHQDDACSPFCICSCCATHALLFSSSVSIETLITPDVINRQNTYYKSPLASNFSGSIWQPPQLV